MTEKTELQRLKDELALAGLAPRTCKAYLGAYPSLVRFAGPAAEIDACRPQPRGGANAAWTRRAARTVECDNFRSETRCRKQRLRRCCGIHTCIAWCRGSVSRPRAESSIRAPRTWCRSRRCLQCSGGGSWRRRARRWPPRIGPRRRGNVNVRGWSTRSRPRTTCGRWWPTSVATCTGWRSTTDGSR